MSSRRPCPPTLYVAVWDDQRIIKPGFTMARRWRDWENRGARIAIKQEFSHYSRAFKVESATQSFLGHWWPLAFSSRVDSLPLMGTCGGWREAYRVTDVGGALRTIARIVRTHAAHDAAHAYGAWCTACMPSSDARTNVRTNGRTCRSPRDIDLALSDAHVRIRPRVVT